MNTAAVSTLDLFATNHDEANRAEVANVAADDLDLGRDRLSGGADGHKIVDRLHSTPESLGTG